VAYDLSGLFKLALGHVQSNPSVSLEELSALLRVERHTIEKAVKSGTGKTFRQLRSSVMLKKARALLDGSPNQSIKEVAFKLGYRSQRSFSRFVKSTLGCTPTKLRETGLQIENRQ
jgi:transcriptional regulator GlxA family with amidase domain